MIAPEYRAQTVPQLSALDTLAADVPDLIHQLGYDRAFLVGHSIGAMVLARMLEQTPEVAEAVVLANGFPYLRILPRKLHWLQPKLVPLLWIYLRLPWIVRQLLSFALLWATPIIFLRHEPDSEKRKMFFSYTFTPDVSMVLRVGAAVEYHDLPDLSRANMPVLVTTGGKDWWLPVHEAKELVAAIPCCEHIIFPSIGHMSPMIVPERFNRAVLQFFGRVKSNVL